MALPTKPALSRLTAPEYNAVVGVVNALDGNTMAATTSPAGSGTITSSSYTTMPSPNSVTITKAHTVTRVRVQFCCSTWAQTAVCNLGFAILVNGTDYYTAQFDHNTTANHRTMPVGVLYITGLSAGSWTFTARWKRISGTGLGTIDTNDHFSLEAMEVP